MPTIFMVIKDNLKKNNNTKIQREALLVEHTVVMVTRETLRFIYPFFFFFFLTSGNNYWHFLLLESALQWVT